VIFVSWERYGRTSERFGGADSNIELGGNQERFGQTLLLPWVFLVDLILDLSQNYYQTPFCSL
jgi:hypothetical protein